MKLLDYLFYMQVKFQMKILKKDVKDSSWSAALGNGLWLSTFVIAILASICLVFPSLYTLDRFVSFITDTDCPWKFIIACFLVCAVMVLRYFRFVDYETIAEEIKRRHNQSLVSFVFWVIGLGNWVFVFVVMRIYFDGQIQWW